MTKVIEHVKNIRKKLTEANVPFVTLGRMWGKIMIYIKIKDINSINTIRNLLNEEENKIVEIERS